MNDDLSHFFETTMPVERFKQVLAGACHGESKVIVEGTDSSHLPRKHFLNVTFGDIADRDRGRIAVRLAETAQQQTSARAGQAQVRASR
ncbi:MAG: hypothetical protein SFV19_12580 [Rhodospirillaceae bacterium]|nr:hypothetical protein [Rhodospirillaceae bacterium]